MAAIASSLQIDRLSLQLRAVRSMLILDPRRARRMFSSISPLTSLIPKLSCSDLAVPDLRQYYETLTVLSNQSFDVAEIQRGDQEKFIVHHLLPLASPLQVFPAMRFLTAVKVSSKTFDWLLSTVGTNIAQVRGDDRAFTVPFFQEEAEQQLRVLVRRCQDSGTSAAAFVDAVRAFYAAQLSDRRCSDTATSQPLVERQARALADFGVLAQGLLPNFSQLTVKARPEPYLVSEKATDLFEKSPEFRKLYQRLSDLGRAQEGSPQIRFGDARAAVEEWRQPDNVAAAEYFQLKWLLLLRLLQSAPEVGNTKGVAHECGRFLATSVEEQQERPAEWLWSAMQIIKFARAHPPQKDVILSELEESSNPALTFYVGLERRAVLPRPSVE
jgi:hypothetical protein